LALRCVRRDVESEPDADGTGALEIVGSPMNTLWIVGGGAVILALVGVVRSWRRRSGDQDLGAVSHQWVAEHRLGRANDSRT
jgi:hypothetical protein